MIRISLCPRHLQARFATMPWIRRNFSKEPQSMPPKTDPASLTFNFQFSRLLKDDLNTFADLKTSFFKHLPAEEQIRFLINHLEHLASVGQLDRADETISELSSLSASFGPNELIYLILAADTANAPPSRSKTASAGLQEKSKAALATLISSKLADLQGADLAPLYKDFLSYSQSPGERAGLSVAQLAEECGKIKSWFMEHAINDFVDLMAVSQLFLASGADPEDSHSAEIQHFISPRIAKLSPSNLLKFLTSIDLTSPLITDDLKYKMEQKIASELIQGMSLQHLTRLIDLLADFNAVFRQKLVFLVNEKAAEVAKQLPLPTKISLLFLNCVTRVPPNFTHALLTGFAADLEKAELANEDLIRLKFLELQDFGLNRQAAQRTNELFCKVDLQGLNNQEILKVFMLAFYSGSAELKKAVKARLGSIGKLEAGVLAPLVIEVNHLWEKGQIGPEQIQEDFADLFGQLVPQLAEAKDLDQSYQLAVKEAIAQMTDQFDEALEKIK